MKPKVKICYFGLILLLLKVQGIMTQSGGSIEGTQQKRIHPSEQSSNYPQTGNLLIGRKNWLKASSTCGLHGLERYCIVSHLKDSKKCFFCYAEQHGIENIVSGAPHRTWWQAENGVENVTIRFDLEAEFHFTDIIISFQTFRPAAMLIERSYDFGETWQVYRYFAHNCTQFFPGIPTHEPQKLTDVICETRYSDVTPSKNGDLIFRVLPSNLMISNPYSKEVQNLLKMTNLRINFTKLHTLGDDLLDNRAEIREKYYYAINDMKIRGSCSCYGHASRCLPLPEVINEEGMVHGRCECTHNTKGHNCDVCEDLYNDLPWKPAVRNQTNACRKCNCNNHATSCHFDQAVYERSEKVSGGVCDNCQHNTRGQNCEQCALYYFHDESKDISDPEACQPCECDPRGSLDEGICASQTNLQSGEESGRCHCKANVQGRHCNECKNGFWNLDPNNPDGCQVTETSITTSTSTTTPAPTPVTETSITTSTSTTTPAPTPVTETSITTSTSTTTPAPTTSPTPVTETSITTSTSTTTPAPTTSPTPEPTDMTDCPCCYERKDNACHDIDECSLTEICNNSNEKCLNYPGNFVCVPTTCPEGYFFKSYPNIFFNCKKKNLTCSEQNRKECLKEPMNISYYYVTFSKNLKLPKTGGIELFKVKPYFDIKYAEDSVEFKINRVTPEEVYSSFKLKDYGTNSQNAGLVITKSVDGPQTIKIEIIMNIYHEKSIIGLEQSDFTIFVSEI